MSGLQQNILGPYLPSSANGGGGATTPLSKEYTFIAGAAQTVYDLAAAPHLVLTPPTNVSIYENEIKLVGAAKYTLLGTVVTLTEAPFAGTIITIRTF